MKLDKLDPKEVNIKDHRSWVGHKMADMKPLKTAGISNPDSHKKDMQRTVRTEGLGDTEIKYPRKKDSSY